MRRLIFSWNADLPFPGSHGKTGHRITPDGMQPNGKECPPFRMQINPRSLYRFLQQERAERPLLKDWGHLKKRSSGREGV
jgi:hypothetical protein